MNQGTLLGFPFILIHKQKPQAHQGLRISFVILHFLLFLLLTLGSILLNSGPT